MNSVHEAAMRLMKLADWYGSQCAGAGHPYADPKKPKQDSADLVARVAADLRLVCEQALMGADEIQFTEARDHA